MEKHYRMDFDNVINTLTAQSGRAQATFFFKLISNLGPSVCRTIIRYCYERLDRYNASLPDNDPNKQRFIKMSNEYKTFIKHEDKSFTVGSMKLDIKNI